ncbi:SPT16-general chromatin factor (subunit of the heterodimeric FACT complex), putative [Rhizoctonia solani AG-3 Rhs1AP]|uniref:FACT complex subunit n=1 Tax=Rhizoctonia solani AG-3 Rhs1AP TaxID=1086054 RepID=X8JMC2_9AGAM|nr:SPT16-general chromatin factor (subunit of the heterodimeric FACT complex), putative [Rhizoctonia solani AG-3 Rhs1AP]
MSVQLNVQQFYARASQVFSSWNSHKLTEFEALAGLDALQILVGDPGDDEMLRKSTALQTWLLGYEFPLTLMVFAKEKIYFLCSSSKAKILHQLEIPKAPIPIEIFIMAKAKDGPNEAPKQLAEALGSVKRLGGLPKEQQTGKIVDDWNKTLEEHLGKPEVVDIAAAIGSIMAIKDEEELKNVRTAAHLSSTLMTHQLASKLELILDRQSTISHESFSKQLESRLGSEGKEPDMRIWSKNKHLANVDFSSAELTFSPVIQSRNSGYDLRVAAEPSTEPLAHKGVVLGTISIRYKGYSAHVSRTFFVDPSKEQEGIYSFVLSLQSELLSKLRDGTSAKDVYAHAISYIKQKKPELEKHFTKNVGFGMGIEYRDSSYLLSPKNARQVKAGMIFNLSIGFSDLEDKDGNKYAMLVSDTVKVGQEKAVCLTEGTKATDEVMFFFQDETNSKSKSKADSPTKSKSKPASAKKVASPNGKLVGSKVLRNKTRQQSADQDVSASTLARITAHQKELHAQRLADGLDRFADDEGDTGGKERKTWKRFQSYKGDAALPKEVDSMRIHVDRRNMTIVVPVHGFAVPFHINTIKNVSKLDEGEFTYLRINFQSPGQLTGRKEDTPFEDPDATFIRSLTYRSADTIHFDDLAKQITELKKEANKREQEKKALADVVEQAELIEIKGRRPTKLPEVFVRPALDGKRLPGEVEIHSNGIRYLGAGGQKIDILYSNIKHLFFAPCDNEMLVIVHCHLKSPIIIGKRKSKDVQFYREASDVQFDETGNRKRKYRYGDEDEIELEQNERKRRQQLNKEFKHFAEKIAEASGPESLEVDIPFRELEFEGVPFRTNVKLQPTTDCLVQLFDPPFLVVTLSEIEIASLERVQFGLKQFDLIFIFNDFSKTPQHINSIPTKQLDSVKEWLDSVEIPMAEGPVNLNWGQIMKTINENPLEFFREGGWTFLGGTAAGSDKSGSDESDTESEFEGESEDELPSSSDSEESEFDDGSDASEDEGSGSELDDDSGDDWDTLEKKAAKSDNKARETGHGHDSDSDRPKKKAPAKAPAKGSGKGSGKAPAKANGRR